MHKMKSLFRSRVTQITIFESLLFLFVFIVLGLVHWPSLMSHQFFSVDDEMLINTVRFGKFNVYDVQPVRDFSYWCDLKIETWFGLRSFHFVNFSIWIGIQYLFFKLLRQVGLSLRWSLAVWALFALHPSLNATVLWISARKHLLSVFFILCATHLYLRTQFEARKSFLKYAMIILFYGLSIFSHPLTLLWPVWTLFHQSTNVKSYKMSSSFWFLILSLCLVGFVAFILNYNYYEGPYQSLVGTDKYIPSSENDLANGFLSLGRYIFQVFVPGWPLLPDHFPGSWQSLAGILLIPIVAFVIFRLEAKKRIWFLFPIFLLLPVFIKLTKIFCSDTYLIGVIAWAFVALALQLREIIFSTRARILLKIAFAMLALWMGWSSWQFSQKWASPQDYWIFAYEKEGGPDLALHAASVYLNRRDFKMAYSLAEKVYLWDPHRKFLSEILGRTIYLDPGYSEVEKVKLLNSLDLDGVWKDYYLAALLASQKDYLLAYEKLRGAFDRDPRRFIREFGVSLEIVLAEAQYFCETAALKSCDQLVLKAQENLLPYLRWDSERYRQRLKDLGI